MSNPIREFICVATFLLSMRHLEGFHNKVLSREERAFLLFPQTNPTRVQYITGIGIPLENLVFEAMTTGYVLKAEFWLPYLAEQLRNKTSMLVNAPNPPVTKRRSMQNLDDIKEKSEETFQNAEYLKKTEVNYINTGKKTVNNLRWAIYKGLEVFGNRIGLSGRACMLKSICEAAEVPFHYKNGVLAELIHILLTPSSSTNGLTQYADNEYYQAESFGLSGSNCEKMFKNCNKSLLDHLTDVHTLKEDFYKIIG